MAEKMTDGARAVNSDSPNTANIPARATLNSAPLKYGVPAVGDEIRLYVGFEGYRE